MTDEIRMTRFTVKFTAKELELLTTLATDQLFRLEFIDPKMPGYRSDSSVLTLGKALVGRLRLMMDPGAGKRTRSTKTAGWLQRPVHDGRARARDAV